jgi:hypothetical protein
MVTLSDPVASNPVAPRATVIPAATMATILGNVAEEEEEEED